MQFQLTIYEQFTHHDFFLLYSCQGPSVDASFKTSSRKDDEKGTGGSLEFPLIENLANYEERVIFYNNQRISILRQKSATDKKPDH
jgi:hypothetical protein